MFDFIDINCDLGEGDGLDRRQLDAKIFPFINSCNIACGFHSGGPKIIDYCLDLSAKHNVRIGAHPSYPDREGFGRRKMAIESDELKAIIKYQVSAIQGMAKSKNLRLSYVKPHGALYNSMCLNEQEAETVISAIKEVDPDLSIMGLANSIVSDIAQSLDVRFIGEAFIDRTYDDDGKLLSRTKVNAVKTDPNECLEQFKNICSQQMVISNSGIKIDIKADSLCIHGDNPNVLSILNTILEYKNKIIEENAE